MKTRNIAWEAYSQTIDKNSELVFSKTMNPNEYWRMLQLLIHEGLLWQSGNVVEIGAGYGGLASLFLEYVEEKKYTDIDNIEMQKHIVGTIEKAQIQKCCFNFIDAAHIEENIKLLEGTNLLISTNCLSEVPEEYLMYIMDNVFPLTDALFLVDSPVSTIKDFWIKLHYYIDHYFESKTQTVFDKNKNIFTIIAKNRWKQ